MLSDSRGRRPRLLSGSRGPYWEDIASSKRKGWKGRNEGKRGREGGRESREGEGGRGRAQAPLFLLSWTLFTFGSAGTRLAIALVLYTDIMIVTPSFFSRQKSRRRGNSVDSSGGWSKLQSSGFYIPFKRIWKHIVLKAAPLDIGSWGHPRLEVLW